MTKNELELAQFLLGVAEGANRHADVLDPEHTGNHPIARHLDAMHVHVRSAFRSLTGRAWSKVAITELSTVSPASWTKTAPGLRGAELEG